MRSRRYIFGRRGSGGPRRGDEFTKGLAPYQQGRKITNLDIRLNGKIEIGKGLDRHDIDRLRLDGEESGLVLDEGRGQIEPVIRAGRDPPVKLDPLPADMDDALAPVKGIGARQITGEGATSLGACLELCEGLAVKTVLGCQDRQKIDA